MVATSGVEDLSGNPLPDFVSSFTTAATADTRPPVVVAQRPGTGATGVATDTSVVLYVNEAVNPATVPGAVLVSENGVLVAGTTTVTGAGRTITVVPTAPLAAEALVEVFVTRDVQDVAGNALSAYQGSFRTAPDPATEAPGVVRTSPSNDATAMPTNGVIEVEYSEPLDPASLAGAVSLREEFGGLAEVPSAVTLVRGGRVIRVEPAAPLAATASYAVEVTTAVRDLDGVAPAARLVSRFTTGAGDDLVPPTVVGVTPPDGAIGVGVNASLRVRFDEPVNPLTVTGATILVSDGVTAAVACTISFGAGDREVVVVPHGPLTAAAVHQVTIAGVEDLAGNPVQARTTQFTTVTGPDTTPPQVASTNPSFFDFDAPVNTVISVDLNEPIDSKHHRQHYVPGGRRRHRAARGGDQVGELERTHDQLRARRAAGGRALL